MLLDNNYTIIPAIKFSLTFDDGVRKVITVKTRDKVSCTYKKNGELFSITGIVSKIGCNFNSSLGAVGTTAYLQIDGSSEYSGDVAYIQPSQVIDLSIISSSDITDNVVCSVDNEDQRISLIRENEVGVFQYSLDGITWHAATGAQGMSAYECAVELGFVGTEAEWLESLKGQPGEPGEAGALEIYKVFKSLDEAERNRDLIPKGKLIAVTTRPNATLYVRNGSDRPGVCPCCENEIIDENRKIKGYDYLGYLTVGPQGEPGRPGEPGEDGHDGKSAYQYAVEGGFPGTEGDFIRILGRSAVAVTNFFMGPTPQLENTVIGPIDLKIFGYTNEVTFASKSIARIDISCSMESEDQTLIFPDPIILRAVPVKSEATKPNIIIKGRKYVADCIENHDGVVGVMRRVRYIESYNGETIISDWISSTGQLDMGARVQFVGYGKFEPFSETVQEQYRKLHTYDRNTKIQTTEGTYMSVVYPINITSFVESYVSTFVQQYLEEKAPEIIEPIVERVIDDRIDQKIAGKQDKLIPGDHINIDANNKISVTDIGDLGASETVVDYVDDKIASINPRLNVLETKIEKKQDKLTAGKNITIENNIISCDVNAEIGEELTTTVEVGGIPAGTVIDSTTTLADILKEMLCPYVPPVPPEVEKVYWGAINAIPTDLTGLTGEEIDEATVIVEGISHRFDADNQYIVYAYRARMGELISIKDSSGFEQIDGWGTKRYTDDEGNEWFIYYSKENVTISRFKLTFIYTD